MEGKRKRYRMRRQVNRRPFLPPEPTVSYGRFKDKRLSDLSDEELVIFLRVDARHQSRPVAPGVLAWGLPPSCADLSQYWFAKYELERRKPEAKRSSSAAFEIADTDTKEDIAWKLVSYGFRMASRRFHPDHGGSSTSMQRLNEARDFVKTLLKR